MTLVSVWRCECGKTLVSGLPSARCPHCRSEYVTVNGSVRVLSGSWDWLQVDDGRRGSPPTQRPPLEPADSEDRSVRGRTL
jgi:hypothetical protein